MKKIIFIFISFVCISLSAHAGTIPFVVGQPLSPWKSGYLDIHHIHEGRGNATFMIFPDGTTLLFDIGDVSILNENSNNSETYSGILPNNSKSPYEWVADYINHFSPQPHQLDYVVLSHFHFDHMGEWDPTRKEQTQGHYRLFGITGLAEKIHIHTLLDRSYPDYQHHGDIPGNLSDKINSENNYWKITAHTMRDYQTFVNYQRKFKGMKIEKFIVGSDTQIHPAKHAIENFDVRNIIGDGDVWTGKNNDAYHFIKYAANDQQGEKIENDLSNGIRIDDGDFRYFTGGDMTGGDLTGQAFDSSAEAVASPVIGRVDVATMDHHGFSDAQSKVFVRTLRPLVWVQQNWAASQTMLDMLMRTTDPLVYPYSRDLFALHYFPLNDLSLPSLGGPNHPAPIDHYYKNSMGSIVIRVEPGGKEFWVIMLSDSGNPLIKAFYGPYKSLSK